VTRRRRTPGGIRLPARTLADLIKLGKQSAAPIQYGSPGVGTLNHLTGELLAQRTGIKLTHVPYKGAAPALNDLLGGHIPLLFSAIPNAHSHVAAGTIHALALTGAKRSPLLPQVPTFAEAGLAGFDVPLRYGLVAPAGILMSARISQGGDLCSSATHRQAHAIQRESL
jgi:tripartite-type tricarboxylate transporter receptor subunit TctC